MTERQVDQYEKKYNKSTSQRESSNYYPLNKGILVENQSGD